MLDDRGGSRGTQKSNLNYFMNRSQDSKDGLSGPKMVHYDDVNGNFMMDFKPMALPATKKGKRKQYNFLESLNKNNAKGGQKNSKGA